MSQWILAVVLVLSSLNATWQKSENIQENDYFDINGTFLKKRAIEGSDICKNAHNKLRSLHQNTSPLEWDDDLANKAQLYANELVEINKNSATTQLIHQKPSGGMGENLYWQDNKKNGTCVDASLSWYSEINDYRYATADAKIKGKAIGHFTQLVWRDTLKFGVGIASIKSRKFATYGNWETFIVAKYSPPGNFYMTGQRTQSYTDNVQPRNAGAVTPTKEELDPSSKPNCEDAISTATCDYFLNSGYQCRGDAYEDYFKDNCYLSCDYC